MVSGVVACSNGGSSDQGNSPPATVDSPDFGESDVAAAQERATSCLRQRPDDLGPLHLSTRCYLHRSFGIGAFSETGELSATGLAAVDSGRAPRWECGDARPILGTGRLVDPARRQPPQRPPDSAEVEVLLGGLYCDARPLTGDDADLWREVARKDGYGATHVLLAAAWATEIGWALEVVDGAFDEAAAIVRSEFGSRHGDRPGALGLSSGQGDDLSSSQGGDEASVQGAHGRVGR